MLFLLCSPHNTKVALLFILPLIDHEPKHEKKSPPFTGDVVL